MAVICGMPAPVTTLVVQIEPGPIPTFTQSTPRSTRSRAASAVAMFPTTSGTSGKRSLICRVASSTPREWACELSRVRTSTDRSSKAAQRSRRSSPTPTPAATRSRPKESLQALGYSWAFLMSLTVIRPLRLPPSSTTNSFSMR